MAGAEKHRTVQLEIKQYFYLICVRFSIALPLPPAHTHSQMGVWRCVCVSVGEGWWCTGYLGPCTLTIDHGYGTLYLSNSLLQGSKEHPSTPVPRHLTTHTSVTHH